MSERHWSKPTANLLVGFAIFFLAMAWVSQIVLDGWVSIHDANAAYQENAERDRDKSADEIAETCGELSILEFRQCVRSNLETHYRDQATNKDLEAQQNMAYWALWLLIASVFGLIISAVGVALLIASLRQTREAINDTKVIGQAEVRAYLVVEKAVAGGNDNDQARPQDIVLHIRNVGATPAQIQWIDVGASAYSVSPGHKSLFSRRFYFEFGAVAPDEIVTRTCDIHRTEFFYFNTESEAMDRVFCVRGAIHFLDVFGSKQTSRFNFEVGPNQRIMVGKLPKADHGY
jgi:hypothetical protein